MIAAMPLQATPGWLSAIAAGEMKTGFPLHSILQSSLYYPASGLNGTPVKYLGGNIHSFIYADYGVSKGEFIRNLIGTGEDCGFKGYQWVRQMDIHRGDLVPRGWQAPLIPNGKWSPLYNERDCIPFGHWSVWKRKADFPPEHGPDVFSFLFLGGEMSAVYQALYTRNKLKPRVLAIIQPGCMGGEWESVSSESSFFKRVIQANPAGIPDYLLYGGFGRGYYEHPCWKEYEGKRLVQLPERYAGLWKMDRESHQVPVLPAGQTERVRNSNTGSNPMRNQQDDVLYELLLTAHLNDERRKECLQSERSLTASSTTLCMG
ncbi:MAG: hypothetical protein U9P42_00615 [Candidatus Fermentibacteria bacterium]|nr:hypothetical protein [Candidatus Fermentibacteria bacterium]